MPSSKRSKFRLTLTSLQICRSKQTASLATCPLPKSLVFSPFNHKSFEISYPNLPEPPPSTPTDLSGIWDVPSNATVASFAEHKPISCKLNMGCRGANFKTSSSRFKKEENINKEKLKATEDRCSSSEETSRSSVEANEETESLVSSHPRSNSSTDKTSIGHEIGRKNVNSGKLKHCYSSNKSGLEQVIPCTEDGKVDESYAVMKRSKSPTDDFKKSMMEMIVEKQMFGVDELERLLSCFLSLNSRQHHAAIVSAFTEVWMALFSQTGWPPECQVLQ